MSVLASCVYVCVSVCVCVCVCVSVLASYGVGNKAKLGCSLSCNRYAYFKLFSLQQNVFLKCISRKKFYSEEKTILKEIQTVSI